MSQRPPLPNRELLSRRLSANQYNSLGSTRVMSMSQGHSISVNSRKVKTLQSDTDIVNEAVQKKKVLLKPLGEVGQFNMTQEFCGVKSQQAATMLIKRYISGQVRHYGHLGYQAKPPKRPKSNPNITHIILRDYLQKTRRFLRKEKQIEQTFDQFMSKPSSAIRTLKRQQKNLHHQRHNSLFGSTQMQIVANNISF